MTAPDRFRPDGGLSDGAAYSPLVRRVLAGLDPEQRAAAEAVRGPVCILAGAGTGKTRAITHRIANIVHGGTAPANHILAVTFTARAAGEMRTRLRALGVGGVQARTFHAAALRQLQFFSPRVLGGQMPELVDRPIRIVANAGGLNPAYHQGQLVAMPHLRQRRQQRRRDQPVHPFEHGVRYAAASATVCSGRSHTAVSWNTAPPAGSAGSSLVSTLTPWPAPPNAAAGQMLSTITAPAA